MKTSQHLISQSSLSPREKKILALRFGTDKKKPLTLQAIGDKFQITRERVRQIQNRALSKLKRNSLHPQ